jgi:ribosomal protein S18 acetylase RimI-like enzyme
MEVRELGRDDRDWAGRLVSTHNASSRIVSRSVLHDSLTLPGLIAESDGVPVGLLQYHVVGKQFEVVVLIAARRRQGIGRFLLRAAEALASSHGCRRIWLVTTNENRAALSFYPAVGWRQVAVHRGAVHESRRLKPEIPELASDGTPIEDEIEFELILEGD